MGELRAWALWLALLGAFLSVLLCIGASFVVSPPPLDERVTTLASPGADVPDGVEADDVADLGTEISSDVADPPGLGIPVLAIVNSLLFVVLALTALPLVIGHRATGLVQGITSAIAGFIAVIAGIILAIFAFVALLLMVGLFLAVPFGTLAYLAVFGFFDTGASSAILGLLLIVQIASAILLVVAQQRFLQNKGLVILILTALLLTIVTAFLHSVVPGFLVSITDAIAAIVSGIVGLIWGLVMLIGGLVSIVKSLNLGRQGGSRQAAPTPAGQEPG